MVEDREAGRDGEGRERLGADDPARREIGSV